MRFLADENFPGTAVYALRSAGHDVAWVRSETPGASDAAVLLWAAREQRVLLTFDKDFGELARTGTLPRTSGAVLFRVPMPGPAAAGLRLAELVGSRNDWIGHFSVVEHGRVRMRRLL